MNVEVIFLIKGEPTFVMRSLLDKFSRANIAFEKIEPQINSIAGITEMPKFFISDAETLLTNKEARIFLCDRCIESNRRFILVGDNSSLEQLQEIIVSNLIAESFVRPVDYDEIVEHTQKLINVFNEKGIKKNILVVDDSATYLRMISEWLEADYNVMICPSPMSALHLIDINSFDLVLLDYEMPICNGAQLLQMIQSDHRTKEIPVIFLTARDDSETVKSVLALKPQGYILKSRTKGQTLEYIANFFARQNIR